MNFNEKLISMMVDEENRNAKTCVFDTETAGDFGTPLIYDLGYAITDKYGNVYKAESFVIKEIFCNKVTMADAFYADKIPQYIEDIAEGRRLLVTFAEAVNAMFDSCREFRVKELAAYNLPFDLRALAATEAEIYNSEVIATEYLPQYGKHDIWTSACTTLYKKKYCKWCMEHGFVSEAGNIKTSAEVGFRYLMNEPEFVESHTGLEDVVIETLIMATVYKRGRKIQKEPIGSPWRVVQQYRPE